MRWRRANGAQKRSASEAPDFARYKLLEVGPRLRFTRRLKKLSRADMAEQLGYGVCSIKNWECGTSLPGLWVLAHWADSCDTTIPYLLGYEGYDEPLRVFTGEIPLRTTSEAAKAEAKR